MIELTGIENYRVMNNPLDVGEESFGATINFVFDISLQNRNVHRINHVMAVMRKFFSVNGPIKVMRLQQIYRKDKLKRT